MPVEHISTADRNHLAAAAAAIRRGDLPLAWAEATGFAAACLMRTGASVEDSDAIVAVVADAVATAMIAQRSADADADADAAVARAADGDDGDDSGRFADDCCFG